MTELCHHTPPSLPSRPSSSAAGPATPAPQRCGMVKGASAERKGRGRSVGLSPVGPTKRSEEGTCYLSIRAFAGTFSKSTFSSLHYLTNSICSLWITKEDAAIWMCSRKRAWIDYMGKILSAELLHQEWTLLLDTQIFLYWSLNHWGAESLCLEEPPGWSSPRATELDVLHTCQCIQRLVCSHTAIPEQPGSLNKPWNQLIYLGNYWSLNISSILRGTIFSCFNITEIRVHLKTDHKDGIA